MLRFQSAVLRLCDFDSLLQQESVGAGADSIFHPREIEMYGDRREHLAPRLAAKRLLRDLLGGPPLEISKLALLRKPGGAPFVVGDDPRLSDYQIFLSLSCDRSISAAFVCLQTKREVIHGSC